MSNRKKRAPKTWLRMIEIKSKLGREGATPAEIIAALREKHSQVIHAEREDLMYLGLTTMLNSICNLKWGAGSSVQADLFEGFDVPLTLTLCKHDETGASRNIKKNLDTLTKGEFRQYIADREAPRKQSRRAKELGRLFDAIRDHGEEDWSVKECWQASRDQSAAL
ncbi:MAG TPA: hypothetical protein VMF67_14535 [Rhizomicrobium sp.]|nr:hypothetical protein [Rhizomicrobium sp.]